MGADGADRRIDQKGRVTIPRRIRDRLDLDPGETVRIETEGSHVVIRPSISREEFIESMEGCLTEDMKRDDAPSISPTDSKAIWTSDLPDGE